VRSRGKYGFYIWCFEESGNDKSALFYAKESSSVDKRPYLEIKYAQ